jgi:Transport and Golgi organisation 2
MCTVTFVPVRGKIFISSNRDEKQARSQALVSSLYPMKTGNVLYPKDKDGRGTWFALNENGNVVVFLNGGKVNHISMPPYRTTRGLILLDLIDSETPFADFLSIDLSKIEPFTAIIWDDRRLFECYWDGFEKYQEKLDPQKPPIWSSVTLYEAKISNKRRKWFSDWIGKNTFPSTGDIPHFHQFTGEGDCSNDLMMNRDGLVFTVSITCLELTEKTGSLTYLDIKSRQPSMHTLAFTKTAVGK